MSTDRTRGNGHNLEKKKQQNSIRTQEETSQTLEQVAQRGCGVCISEHIQNLTGNRPEQPALINPLGRKGRHHSVQRPHVNY